MFTMIKMARRPNILMPIVNKLKRLRRKGLTYKQIAEEIGLAESTVYEYVNNKRKPQSIPKINLTELELAYLAGFFDGEGTIGVYRKHHNRVNKYYKCVEIQVANTNKKLMDYLHKLLPENTYRQRQVRGQYGKCDLYILRIGNMARQYFFLKALLPYLHIKKDNCLEAMEFLREKLLLDDVDDKIKQKYSKKPKVSEKD